MQHILIADQYSRYKQLLLKDNGEEPCVYMGEYLAVQVERLLDNEKVAHIVWECPEGLESCLVEKTEGRKLRITTVEARGNFLKEDSLVLPCLNDEATLIWQNLCHYSDRKGAIRYDPYYDALPAFAGADDGTTMDQLRQHLEKLVTSACNYNQGDTVVLAGNMGRSNLLHDVLRRTMGVKTIAVDTSHAADDPSLHHYDITDSNSSLRLYMCGTTDQTQATLILPTVCGKEYTAMLASDDANSAATIFPGVTVKDLFQDNNPDMLVQGGGVKSFRLRTDADMMGNQWLTVSRADGSTCRFFAMAEIIEKGTADSIISTKTKTEKPQ